MPPPSSAWSRVDAKKHHWYDVAASAGFAFGFSKVFTTRYHAPGLEYGANISPDGGYVPHVLQFLNHDIREAVDAAERRKQLHPARHHQ